MRRFQDGGQHFYLNGVRFHVFGDPNNDYVSQMVHNSLLDLQKLKDRSDPSLEIMDYEKPPFYSVRRYFGQDEIFIYPEAGRLEGEREEVYVREPEEEKTYRFVPAIILGDASIVGTSTYWHYLAWQAQGDISVCGDSYWQGVTDIVRDSPTANKPNEIYKDGQTTKKLEVLACRNWGNRDFWWWFDTDESKNIDIYNVSPFNVAPYLGFSLDGAKDYLLGAANNIKSPVAETAIAPICSQYTTLMNACYADPVFACDEWHWNDSLCLEYKYLDDPRCCINEWRNSGILARMRCGTGHLYFEYQGDAYQERHYETGVFRIMGLCMGYGFPCTEFVHTVIAPRTTGGSPQQRVVDEYGWVHYYVYTNDDIERSGGPIIFDWDGIYRDLTNVDINALMTAPCETSQTDSSVYSEVYPMPWNIYGAFIQDIGNPAYICPNVNFHNTYFLLMVEENWHYFRTAACSPWRTSGYGYDVGGNYDQGVSLTCLSGQTVHHDEYYRILVINLNGERIVIDSADATTPEDYFYIMDSLILDFVGTPVYMYGYMRARRISSTEYQTIYTRYGYFLNDMHYQSEQFHPAGVYINKHLYNLHDVYGSVASEGKYGFGQCAGFVVKETLKTEEGILYEDR